MLQGFFSVLRSFGLSMIGVQGSGFCCLMLLKFPSLAV